MGPCRGARHEALNEGLLSPVGGFAHWGVGHGRVISTEKLTAPAFEALQVIPHHCLLIEFSGGWVSGLGPQAWQAIGGDVALTEKYYTYIVEAQSWFMKQSVHI